jgi:hypothetical protein
MGNAQPGALLPYSLHDCATYGYLARLKYLLEVRNVAVDSKDSQVR